MVANTHTSNQRVRRSAATFKLTPADDRTTFTDSGADFQAYMVGWLLQPDVELPSYLEIVEVDESSGNWVRVKGDADTLATSGSTYRIHAPPGVSTTTGALITGLEGAGSHWLWAGYEYVPPMVGFADPAGQDPGIYGAQSGGNKLGSYHCWNRVYDPATGRWTTTDPAMTPWRNLVDYVNVQPLTHTDPAGLFITLPNPLADLEELMRKLRIRREIMDIAKKLPNDGSTGGWVKLPSGPMVFIWVEGDLVYSLQFGKKKAKASGAPLPPSPGPAGPKPLEECWMEYPIGTGSPLSQGSIETQYDYSDLPATQPSGKTLKDDLESHHATSCPAPHEFRFGRTAAGKLTIYCFSCAGSCRDPNATCERTQGSFLTAEITWFCAC